MCVCICMCIYICMCVYVCMWVCGFTLTCAWGPLNIMSEQQAAAVHICLSSPLWSTYPMPPSTSEARLAVFVCCMCACIFVSLLKAVALIEAHRAIRALHLVQLKSMICLLSWLSFTSCCSHIQIQCTVPLSRPDTVKTRLCETLKHLKGYSTPKWKCCRSKPVKALIVFATQFKIYGIKTRRVVTVPLTAK